MRIVCVMMTVALLGVGGDRLVAQRTEPSIDAVARAIDAANKASIRRSDLRTRQNPRGEGTFVYVEAPQRVLNVNRRFMWMVLDGKAYTLNGPSKGVTPKLPWPREAPEGEWKRTNLSPYSASEALKILFGE